MELSTFMRLGQLCYPHRFRVAALLTDLYNDLERNLYDRN